MSGFCLGFEPVCPRSLKNMAFGRVFFQVCPSLINRSIGRYLLTYFSVFYELNTRASLVGAINISLNGMKPNHRRSLRSQYNLNFLKSVRMIVKLSLNVL